MTRLTLSERLGNTTIRVLTAPLGLLEIFVDAIQSLIGEKRMGYFFVLPNLAIFGVFILLPTLLNFYFGLTSGTSILPQNREFVGAANLTRLFNCTDFTNVRTCQEDLFWRGIWNTVGFVSFEVGLMVIFGLITALALNRRIRGRGFFRSVFFYPVLLSPVVVALIWKWMLQYQNGVINSVLLSLGGERIEFLTDPNWATFWAIVISVWAQMGFYTLILLAGLQSIPSELYEVAQIDGATEWDQFSAITLPLLMPTMWVVLVLALIRAVQVFDVVFVLTGGGPGTATQYIVQYIYQTAFDDRQYGLAAAASLVLAVTLFVLTMGQLWLGRSRQET
jgi:alpha-1,4-digalacturonate transport system permease protein